MFKSEDAANVKPSSFCSKSCVLGNGGGFLLILLFNSLKSEMNLTVKSFSGIINVGEAYCDWLTFFSTPHLTNLSASNLSVYSYDFGIG